MRLPPAPKCCASLLEREPSIARSPRWPRQHRRRLPCRATGEEISYAGPAAEEYDKIVVDAGGFQGAVVSALRFSPDGRWLAAAGDVVRIWDLETGNLLHTLRRRLPAGGASGATSLAFSPDGRRLLVSVSNLKQTLHLYDTGDLTQLHDQFAAGHDGYVDKLALSADGRWLVTAGIDQVVHVWDWPRRQKVASYRFQQPLDYLGFPNGNGPAAAINVKGTYASFEVGPAKAGQTSGATRSCFQSDRLARPRSAASVYFDVPVGGAD